MRKSCRPYLAISNRLSTSSATASAESEYSSASRMTMMRASMVRSARLRHFLRKSRSVTSLMVLNSKGVTGLPAGGDRWRFRAADGERCVVGRAGKGVE